MAEKLKADEHEFAATQMYKRSGTYPNEMRVREPEYVIRAPEGGHWFFVCMEGEFVLWARALDDIKEELRQKEWEEKEQERLTNECAMEEHRRELARNQFHAIYEKLSENMKRIDVENASHDTKESIREKMREAVRKDAGYDNHEPGSWIECNHDATSWIIYNVLGACRHRLFFDPLENVRDSAPEGALINPAVLLENGEVTALGAYIQWTIGEGYRYHDAKTVREECSLRVTVTFRLKPELETPFSAPEWLWSPSNH
jgi:hypothetical protein